jgi:iron complex outermembrane receptor protein
MRAFVCRVLITCTVAAWLWPAAAAAQPSAVLTGVVTAADGARLPGVMLNVLHLDSGLQVEAVTSDAGLFQIRNIPPGRCHLDATLPGFESQRISDLMLAAGDSISVTVRLNIASLHEEVRVVGVAPRDSVEAFEMRQSRARDLGEAMAAIPGMVKVRKGAIASDIVLRGFQGKDVTVLIDGQRIDGACPGQMDPAAFHVDFAEVNRVEVSKGPFDVKNQGGLAGLVNVVTERPQPGWHGLANLTLASAATRALSATGSIGGERLSALGGASVRAADPYRNGDGVSLIEAAGYRRDVTGTLRAYDVWTGWGRVALTPRAGTTVQASYTRQSADTIVYPYLQMDALFDTADRAGVRVEIAELPAGWNAFAAHAYYSRVDHWMTDQFRTSALGKPREYSMGTRADTGVAGGRAEIQRGSMAFGFEASRRNWNTSTMLAMLNYAPQAALPDVTMDVAGAFATYSRTDAGPWGVEAGARVDRASTTADPLLANVTLFQAYHGTSVTHATDILPTGYARARWRGHHGWSGMFGLGHSTRLPDQQERFYGLKRMGADWVGNPGLEPSRNTGLDSEVRFTGRGVDVGVAAFAYRVDDDIVVIDRPRQAALPGVMNLVARSYANVDVLMRGVELNGTAPLAPALFVSGDLSIVRGTAREPDVIGQDLPEIPPARARVRLRYDNARWNGVAEVVASARQDRVASILRESPTPAFAIVNVQAGMRLRFLNITAAVDNLLDTLYAEHLSYQRDPFRSGVRVYEPGRTISLTVSTRF